MTSKQGRETEDKELLDRYRRASDGEASTPSDAVRAAILAESRRVAEQLAQNAKRESQPVFDTARPAANDARWKITAFGTLGAALLAALIIAPRYWESLPARKESAAAQTAQVSVPASEPATVQQAPLQLAPSETSAPKAESAAPAPILEQSYAASSKDAGRTSDAIAQSSPPAPSRPAPSTRAAGNSLSESADRMFKRTQIPATLQSAAKSGDAVLAAKLPDEGATVNVRDAHGQTPLMLAVEQGQLDVVRLLLQRGADPNATDDTGRTPLQKAKLQNLKEIETLLEGAGAR